MHHAASHIPLLTATLLEAARTHLLLASKAALHCCPALHSKLADAVLQVAALHVRPPACMQSPHRPPSTQIHQSTTHGISPCSKLGVGPNVKPLPIPCAMSMKPGLVLQRIMRSLHTCCWASCTDGVFLCH